MTITRADVADLRAGDVVEITDERWPDGSVLRGPAYFYDDELRVGHLALATRDGRLYLDRPKTSLRVVSRAPRPLYVNSDKTEPDPGDVVTTVPEEDGYEVIPGWQPTWCFTQHKVWIGTFTGTPIKTAMPDELRLLVDGRTGQVVL